MRPVRPILICPEVCRSIPHGREFQPQPAVQHRTDASLTAGAERRRGNRELVSLYWGLIPYWSKELRTGYSTIQRTRQSVAEKPTFRNFRNAFRHRRCLIAADGYYEWRKLERTKQPYFIALKDGEPFAFAGVWEHWARDEQSIDSCAIIVTEANELTKPIHDRMPVILAPADYDTWMDPDLTDADRLTAYLKPYPSERMLVYLSVRR